MTAGDAEMDESDCGSEYDHRLDLVDERDGLATYICRECGVEIIEEAEGPS